MLERPARIISALVLSSFALAANGQQVKICAAPFTSMLSCSGSQSELSGYEASFLSSVLTSLVSSGLTSYGNVSYTCMPDVQSMVSQLQLPPSTRTCDIALGGVVNQNLSSLGIRTSIPSWNGGLAVLISQSFPPDPWMFLKPFDRNLWLAIFGTAVVLAISIWFMEVKLDKVLANPGPAWKKYSTIQFSSLGLFLQGIKDFTISTPGGRLAVLGWCFLVVIVVNSYIAVLTTQLTVTTRVFKYTKLSEVTNQPVGACQVDIATLKSRFGFNNVRSVPCGSPANETTAIDLLSGGSVTALIWPSALVEFYSANRCDLYRVATVFSLRDYVLTFSSDTPFETVAAFNQAIVALKEGGTVESLRQQEIYKQVDCKLIPSLVTNGIGIVNLSGLWILLAGCLGLALLVAAVQWLWLNITCCQQGEPDAESMERNALSVTGSVSKFLSRSRSSFKSFSNNSAALKDTVHVLGAAGSDEEQLEKLEIMLDEMDKRLHKMSLTTEHALRRIAGSLPTAEHYRYRESGLSSS